MKTVFYEFCGYAYTGITQLPTMAPPIRSSLKI